MVDASRRWDRLTAPVTESLGEATPLADVGPGVRGEAVGAAELAVGGAGLGAELRQGGQRQPRHLAVPRGTRPRRSRWGRAAAPPPAAPAGPGRREPGPPGRAA